MKALEQIVAAWERRGAMFLRTVLLQVFLAFLSSGVVDAQTPVLKEGFPVSIRVTTGSGIGGPTLADVNRDGNLEIVYGSADSMYVFRYNGVALSGWPQSVYPRQFSYSPAVGDIDGDGENEIVALASSMIYAWHYNGVPVTGFPVGFGTAVHAPVLYDLDGDGVPEIIEEFTPGGLCNENLTQLYVIKGNGIVMNGWPQPLTYHGTGGKPAVADLDGDGFPEIFAASSTCYGDTGIRKGAVLAWHGDGSLVNGFPVFFPKGNESPFPFIALFEPAVLPRSSNNQRSIVFGGFLSITPFNDSAIVYVINSRGEVLAGWPQPAGGFAIHPSFAATGSNFEDAVIYINVYFDIHVWLHTGELLSYWQALDALERISPADIDTVSAGFEFALDTGIMIDTTGFLRCTYLGGQELPWSPLNMGGQSGYSQAAFGDLENDGNVEMVVVANIIGSGLPRGYIWCWTFPGLRFTKERFPWPMYGHDRWHTSQAGFDPDKVVVSVNDEQQLPSKFQLQQNYPNPFNPSTTIRFDIAERTHIALKVFDVLGREVETLVNEQKEAGRYSIPFDASKLASGVYLYRIKAGNFVETRKLVLLK